MNDITAILRQLDLQPGTLAGQTVVITGAGRGIGRSAALAFGCLGADVAIAELSDQGQETEGLIVQNGGRALFIRTDVSNPESVANLARQVEAAFGPAWALINNAILSPVASVLEMDVGLWDRVMAVNLRGALLMCQAFLPGMLAQKRGVILNMVSTDAMPYISAYIASKQGLAAFSQSLAAEVGESGVKVVAFGPGFVDTPGLSSTAQGLAPHLGMTVNQFMGMSFHPAYEKAMPVEDAGAATALLAVRLAGEYHGEIVTGYTVLERAGYLKNPANGQPAPHSKEPPTAQANSFQSLAGLSQKLEEALRQTEAEFGKLPIFVRPMARGGFKSKAGQSLQDWAHTTQGLTGQLKQAASGDTTSANDLRSGASRLINLLGKLETYFREVPAQTAAFTKDQELLREVQRISDERVALIQELARGLSSI